VKERGYIYRERERGSRERGRGREREGEEKEEELFILTLSYSKRVRTDLLMAELQAENKNECNLSLVIREWNPAVLPDWEFRGKHVRKK
jgi:hypothetical protein